MSSFTAVVVPLADKVPTDNDVVAGPVGFLVFMSLIVAVALLLWSFSRHLKKARVNFGVDERPRTIPVAGTPEAEAALAEALVGPEPIIDTSSEEPPSAPGRHRGTPDGA